MSLRHPLKWKSFIDQVVENEDDNDESEGDDDFDCDIEVVDIESLPPLSSS